MFPKIGVGPPNHPILIGFSIVNHLRGGVKTFFIFTPKLGEDEPMLTFAYFSTGWEKTTNHIFFAESFTIPYRADLRKRMGC